MEDHTSDWLRVVPISGLGQTLNGRTYRCVLCYRLGALLFSVLKQCSACSRVFVADIYGDHAIFCAGIVGIKYRHNIVHDTLVDICFRSGISVGLDVCVDLTGSSPLTQTGMIDFVPGRAVIEPAQRKRVKYEAKCVDIGYGFLPFSFSSFGELEKDAITLLKRIRRFFVTQDIGARAVVHIFNRIGFAIARGVGAQIVSWLPTNFLIMVRKEAPIGFLSEDGKDLRLVELLLFNWFQDKDACLDVTGISPLVGMGEISWAPGVALHNAMEKKKRKYASIWSSPLTQTRMADFVPVRATIDAAKRKRVKYEAICANIGGV
ncbi:hypothetical protein Tco_1430544 [Tanacetum coccineum]